MNQAHDHDHDHHHHRHEHHLTIMIIPTTLPFQVDNDHANSLLRHSSLVSQIRNMSPPDLHACLSKPTLP